MGTPGAALLSHVPKSARSELFSGLIDSLRPDDSPSIHFVAAAVAEGGDEGTTELLIKFLCRGVATGNTDAAVTVAIKYPHVGARLFSQSAEVLAQAKSKEQQQRQDSAAVASHLRFCKSVFSRLPFDDIQRDALSSSIDLLADADTRVCHAARDLIFAALSNSTASAAQNTLLPLHPAIWTQVQNLTGRDGEKDVKVLGYSLWLRWLLAIDHAMLDNYMNDLYWVSILGGLRQGDAEIRKLCLNILKLSMASEASRVSPQLRAQFERYATVFETIVLGRYINQIQECESDLNSLISQDSLIDTKWVYALLASALDGRVQDSNRRFIGNWVLSAGPSKGNELVAFLRDDFLPWATQGSVFVASLKQDQGGRASCSHGDRLASYIRMVLQHGSGREEIFVVVWSYVNSKKTFAYAKVWLLNALSEGQPAAKSEYSTLAEQPLSLPTSGHAHGSAEQISRGLPAAANDYVSWKLAELGVKDSSQPSNSRRDDLEKDAILKCGNVHDSESLSDLCSDLDYLEFPKELLFHIPKAVLNPQLVDAAVNDSSLASSLRDMIATLQKVAETKTYLISPLNVALRSAVLRNQRSFEFLGVQEYIIRAVDNPPEPTIDLMLEEATVHLFARYEDYFGERPSHGTAALLDLVSRTRDQAQLEDLIDQLVKRWKTQKVPPPTVSSWKTTLQLQTLLLGLENLKPTEAWARQTVADLLRILSIEPLPRYRYLLEWMVVRLLQRMRLEGVVLDQLASKDHHANPKFLASLMKIGSIIACSASSSEEFATTLATLYVPLAASSKVVIRHEAQWQVPILIQHAREQGWKSITDNAALSALDDYIRSLDRFSEPPLERKIGRFDPETDHTITNLVEGAWFGLDNTEAPLTSRVDFAKLHADELPTDAPGPCMSLGSESTAHAPAIPTPNEPSKPNPSPRTIDDVTALQTKGAAYLARTLSDPTTSPTRPHNLIVVGSLVDNPYNLGGLSRVSEIFGASALTLQNQNVIGNKDFTSVSVSSHLHFPIVQLSAGGVPGFLAERKAEGFTVVGIEQTDRSVVLGAEEAKLPEKCVLVVGSEKEGIPAVVLTECDVLVEIPQSGVTRSLNVQTAVGVVLFEYARQRKMS